MTDHISPPRKIGVVFGSRSVEHEVSIITATQLMASIPAHHTVVPLYIDKQGQWWTGASLQEIATFRELDLQNPEGGDRRQVKIAPAPQAKDDIHTLIDVAIFCVHGAYSEDGTLAGLFELLGIPYVGPGVVGAAVAIDKIITKHVVESAGLNVTDYGWFSADDWRQDQVEVLHQISHLSYPMFVKPASLGSSVGVTKVKNESDLIKAVDLATEFDSRIIVEEAAPADAIEVNISVLGTGQDCEASVSEQPIQTDEFLSYADKYERGGGKKDGSAGSKGSQGSKGMASLSRNIPAPIAPSLEEALQEAACYIWKLVDGFGVARIDFFANPTTEEFWVGEINSPPGSMSYYLWEACGLSYPEMIERLISIAQERFDKRAKLFTSIESNILKNK
jgi:D-alanine-D-alanine ligase